ncbi:hypothetical protein LXL04_026493 [Taraxacum kok-saghyz]
MLSSLKFQHINSVHSSLMIMVSGWWRIVAAVLLFHGVSFAQTDPGYSFMYQATTAPPVSYYDYIIVGGGTAGCPLAATLSQNFSVLLLERGGHPYGNDNITNLAAFGAALSDLSPSSPSQRFVSTDGVVNARARVLGGGSCLNAGFYTRAGADYVRLQGWDAKLVNESYKWVEDVVAFEPPLRQWQTAVRDGLVEAGIRPYNGFTYEHMFGTKVGGTIFDPNGHRHTAADLLRYANSRGLTVLLYAPVNKILFTRLGEGRKPKAHGVIFKDANGVDHRAYLKRGSMNEIIVSSGSLGSPQLLMLSGVGPKRQLRAHNITMVLEQPMVGLGMSDNPMNAVFIPSPQPVEVSLIQIVGITHNGTYIESACGENFAGGARTQDYGMFSPKIGQLSTLPPKQRTQKAIDKAVEDMKALPQSAFVGGFILEKIVGPISTGHLEITSRDPNVNPTVTFNYFKDPRDLQRCVDGIKIIERVIDSKAFSPFRVDSLSMTTLLNMTANSPVNLLPKHANASRSLEQFCKDTVMTIWHYHGGCEIARVVDRNYKVIGIDSLRVIDGSTFRNSPGTNPQATVMMLGRGHAATSQTSTYESKHHISHQSMTSPCIKEVSRACFRRCCPTPLLRLPDKESPEQTISPSRYDFIAATASSLPPNAQFTNHESLPDLERSFSAMKKAYPYYPETDRADRIRSHEYYHLSNHITHGGHEQDFESLIKERIFRFMNISSDDYALVFTANQSSAFKVLADNYPFHTNRNLLTVYDHENEAVETMIESCKKRSGRVDSALFAWPNMRVHSKRLRKSVVDKNKKKKKRKGLFVFPLQSKVTGTRYSYLWMSLAQENGWHVCLDANAFGAKDMETLGLSLFQPDFLICSFYKIFGENPSGFGCLFVKKSKSTVLKNSSTSTGLVNIVQASNRPLFLQQSGSLNTGKQEDIAMASSSSSSNSSLSNQETFEIQEIKEKKENENEKKKEKGLSFSEIWKHDRSLDMIESRKNEASSSVVSSDTEFRGLDLADSLGLILISSRVRYLVNWLVNAFGSLQHPHSENGVPLVRIYGPKVRVDRGPVLAFNVFDWKGEKVEPTLVQKLADRYNISLSYATLKHVCFVDKSCEEREILIENEGRNSPMNKRKEKIEVGIPVIMATVGFLTNFEDVYRVWVFVSRFLDADFVEKERWRYMALNRTTVEMCVIFHCIEESMSACAIPVPLIGPPMKKCVRELRRKKKKRRVSPSKSCKPNPKQFRSFGVEESSSRSLSCCFGLKAFNFESYKGEKLVEGGSAGAANDPKFSTIKVKVKEHRSIDGVELKVIFGQMLIRKL